jgi:PIN domain nuclease of toxin-antitoxin system
MNSPLLLDTHIWIWVNNAEKTLTTTTQKIIDLATQNQGIYISAITLWEISTLAKKGRIILNMPCLHWMKEALALPGITLLPISPEIAVESNELPEDFHGDPADRILVATARIERLTLVTRDQKILDYGKKDFVSVLKA